MVRVEGEVHLTVPSAVGVLGVHGADVRAGHSTGRQEGRCWRWREFIAFWLYGTVVVAGQSDDRCAIVDVDHPNQHRENAVLLIDQLSDSRLKSQVYYGFHFRVDPCRKCIFYPHSEWAAYWATEPFSTSKYTTIAKIRNRWALGMYCMYQYMYSLNYY